jgi:hypothetical protein
VGEGRGRGQFVETDSGRHGRRHATRRRGGGRARRGEGRARRRSARGCCCWGWRVEVDCCVGGGGRGRGQEGGGGAVALVDDACGAHGLTGRGGGGGKDGRWCRAGATTRRVGLSGISGSGGGKRKRVTFSCSHTISRPAKPRHLGGAAPLPSRTLGKRACGAVTLRAFTPFAQTSIVEFSSPAEDDVLPAQHPRRHQRQEGRRGGLHELRQLACVAQVRG